MRWSDSKLANGVHLFQLMLENTHIVDLMWTTDERANVKMLGEDTPHNVNQEHGWFTDGDLHVFRSYWEILRIKTIAQENGMRNGHTILGWIL